VKSVLPLPLLLHTAEARQLRKSKASIKAATGKLGEDFRAGS